jgi:uncharacterized membrane protein (UPF0127 family)
MGHHRSVLRSILLIALVACSSDAATQPASMRVGTVAFAKHGRLQVRIAETEQERQTGLMHVMALAEDDGMAFVFPGPVTETFWMKDTLIPLSVAFVDADDRVVSITDMQPCTDDPCPTYAAARPYTLAVEANLGWFSDHDVTAGDPARLAASDG